MKKVFKVILVFVIIDILFLFFAPFKYHEDLAVRAIRYDIEIDASKEFVFDYLGNSNNAKEWSVFVDHIVTLNGSMVPDGEINSLRRCFKNPDKKGIKWDEEILEVINNRKRKLSCFNLEGFFMETDNIRTEQLYHELEKDKTHLTFSVYFEGEKSILDIIKIRSGSWYIKYIFKKNMENIKRICESKFEE